MNRRGYLFAFAVLFALLAIVLLAPAAWLEL